MITYQQLCEQQQKYHNTLIQRRDQLRNHILDFCIDLEKNLGLTDKRYKLKISDDIATQPYIRLLNTDTEKTESINIYEQPVSFDKQGNPSADVSISLTLEKAENAYPKNSIYIKIRFTLNQDELILTFVEVKDSPQFTVNVHYEDKFKEAIEGYKQAIMRTFTL